MKEVFIIFRFSVSNDVMQEIWSTKDGAENRVSQLKEERPYATFYIEGWKLNAIN